MNNLIKKTVAGFAAAALVFGSAGILPEGIFEGFNITASAETELSYGNFRYVEIGSNGIRITKYISNTTAIIDIPKTIGDRYVTELGANAFSDKQAITTVIMPDSVTYIGDDAFKNCYGLTNITFSNSLKKIGLRAFRNCEKLKSIHIPKSLTECAYLSGGYLSRGVFAGSGLKNVTFEEGITQIATALFFDCESLEEITIPNTVETICGSAFRNCTGLKKIVIPDSVTKINKEAFQDCTYLTDVTLGNNVKTINNNVFYNCVRLTDITIPNSVTYIGDDCFKNDEALANVKLSNSLEKIGLRAFQNCVNLTSIHIPKSLTECAYLSGGYLSRGVFAGSGLKNVTFEEGVKQIATALFFDCESLEEITIPNTVETICGSAFRSCTGLKKIVIPDSVIKINKEAFHDSKYLSDVYYKGTEDRWHSINIGEYNAPLLNATIHFMGEEKPLNPVVTATPGDGCAVLTWTAVDGADRYAAYTVDDAGNTTILNSKINDTTYTATKLTNGTEYTFLVRAYVDGKWSKYSANDYVKATPVSAVVKPEVTAKAGDEQITLTWNEVPDAAKYAVYIVQDDNTLKALATKLTDTAYTAKKLTSGTEYTFLVRAYVNGKWTKYDATDYVKATPFSTVVKPTVEVIPADKQVTLTWDAIDGATKYAVYRLQDDGTLKALATKLTDTEYTVKKLTNHTEYKFLVRAYINGKWTKYDESDYVTCTPAALKPLVRVSEYDSMVTLRWGAVDDATKYAAYIVNDDGSLTCVSSKITNIKYTIKNLTNGTAYRFVVRAYVDGKWTKYTERDIVSATPNA